MTSIQGSLPRWGERELSDAQRRQAKAALSRCLGSDHISTRQGPRNTKIPYLDVSTTIRLANEAFRYDGWSSNIISVTQDFLREDRGVWSCCYTALVRITLPNGCYHDGIGVGNAESARLQADAIEKAKKSAVSDAMKRALRCFGEGLGNNITSDSATSRGTVLSIYEDEFAVKETVDQATDALSMSSSKRLRTVVSPISTGQFNQTTACTAAQVDQQLSVQDAFSTNTDASAVGDLVAQGCSTRIEANIAEVRTNLPASRVLEEKRSLFQAATNKDCAKQGLGNGERKMFHTMTSNGREEKTLPSEPPLKQCQPMFSKARPPIFNK